MTVYDGVLDQSTVLDLPFMAQERTPSQPPAAAPAPVVVAADPEPIWLPPDWDALADEYPKESLTAEQRQSLALEVEFRLHYCEEAATSIGEAAILAAERFQDEQIEQIVRELQGDWAEELVTALLVTLVMGVFSAGLGATLSVLAFRPMLKSSAGSYGRSLARMKALPLTGERGGQRVRIGSVKRPSQWRQALAVLDDPKAMNALPPGKARELAEGINEILNTSADDIAAKVGGAVDTSTAAVVKAAGRSPPALAPGRAQPAEPDETGEPAVPGTARTQLLDAMFDLAAKGRLAYAVARYNYSLRILQSDLTFAEAANVLADLRSEAPIDATAFKRRRTQLATAFEAVIWSRSLSRLDRTPTPYETLASEHGPVREAKRPLKEICGDAKLADYLVGRFKDAAAVWVKSSKSDVEPPTPDHAQWSGEYAIIAYLKAMRAAGVEQNLAKGQMPGTQ